MKRNFCRKLTALLIPAAIAGLRIASAQTQINLAAQGKSPDFSNMGQTKPFQTGTSLLATCAVGAVYFLTTAPAGSNLQLCTAPGTWTPVNSAAPGGSLSGTRVSAAATDALSTSDNGVNVVYDGSGSVAVTLPQAGSTGGPGALWTAFVFNGTAAGNVTITPVVSNIDGSASLVIPPLEGVSLWSDGTNYHTNGTLITPGTGVIIANRQVSADPSVMLSIEDYQTAQPLECFPTAGQSVNYTCSTPTVFSAYANGMRINWQPDVACTGNPTISVNGLPPMPIREAGGGLVVPGDCDTPHKNLTLAYNSLIAGGPYWEILGGGAGTGIGSASLPPTVVETNQSNKFTTGTQDFSSVQHSLPAPTGLTAAMPTTCSVGEEYFASDATAGQNLYICTASGVWTQLQGSGSGGASAAAAAAPYIQIGSNYYLPFGFAATIPPATGWTGVNMNGSGFTTSGLGGALSLSATAYSQAANSVAAQYRSLGGTSTLTAAVTAGEVLTGQYQFCGVGVLLSSNKHGNGIFQLLNGSGWLEETQWTGANGVAGGKDFDGNSGAGGAQGMVFFKLHLSGSVLTLYYSTEGLVWTQMNTRYLGYTPDSWMFAASGLNGQPVNCQLLSWTVQ